MKIQIIKTLALLGMLTLNACGTAPIAVSPTAGDDEKEANPETNGVDDKTPETIIVDNRQPLIPLIPCTTNPFGATCNSDYKSNRDIIISECRIDSTDGICLSASASVCTDNPFDVLCTSNFNTARDIITAECRKDDTGTLCPQAIARVCLANPFDELCGDDYENARDVDITRCRLSSRSSCPQVITKICGENPFDNFCDNNPTYQPARDKIVTECRTTKTGKLCPLATINICRSNAFDKDFCFGDDTYDGARTPTCRRESDSDRCETTVSRICDETPFDTICNNNSVYEMMRISDCIMGDNANESRCRIFSTNSCVRKPFGTGCDGETTARMARETFCREGSNSKNTLCVGAVAYFCGVSVFDGLCGSAYESMRIDDCIIAGNAGETRCTNAFATGSCVLNPFGANCDSESYLAEARMNRVKFCSDSETSGGNLCMNIDDCYINPFGTGCFADTTYDVSRNLRISFCGVRENNDDGICTVALARPNVASFLQSFYTPLPTLANVSTRHDFLQGTATGLDNGRGGSIATHTLNLDIGDDGDQVFGGDAADGLAVYSQRRSSTYYYAGIFSGTDLGARLTETEGTAEWRGRFRTIGNSDSVNKDFTLTVNFGAGDQAGTISARVFARSSSYYYSLTGNFDNNGVIRGDTQFVYTGSSSSTTPGRLRGLIGQEGAVGVFVSNNDGVGNYSYSGGFIAVPSSE
ncbi:MAG: hypothetical protein K0U41_00775 [Gammaproteobacteria bacterium]|nr:hypothetical protein [Gammaproteobacteria bacterium]